MRREKIALVLLFFAGFCAYSCNHACMIYVPLYVVAFGGTLFQAGMQATVFLAAAVLLRFWSGPMADRRGPKLLMIVGLGAYCAATPLLGLCQNIFMLLCVRCLQAVGMASFFPCAMAAVGEASARSRSGLTLGMYRLVSSVALMAASPAMFSLVEAWGYGMAFAWCGGAAAVGLGAVAFVPAELCRPHNRTRAESEADAQTGVFGTVWVGDGLSRWLPLVVVTLATTLLAALGYGLATNFATPFVEASLPQANAGVLMALVGAGGLVANPLSGWLVDRRTSLKMPILFAGLAGVGICLVAAAGVPFAMELSGLLIGLGYFGTVTSAVALLAKLAPPHHRAFLISQQQNAVDVGIGVSGLLFGAIITVLGPMIPFLLAGATIAVVSAILVLVFVARFDRF